MTRHGSPTLGRSFLILLYLTICLPAFAGADYEAAKAAWLAQTYDQAFALMEPLAKQGDVRAQASLALIYAQGLGVAKDPQKAITWYTRAAEAGLAQAQFDLGSKYFRGDIVPRATDKAVHWWRKAAQAGLAEAQYNLALSYERGTGIAQDARQALHWYLESARQGHALAQYALGVLYADGRGTRQDLQQARTWFEAAAVHDIAAAQYNLGLFHELGQATRQDVGLAIRWYRRAARLGLQAARDRLASFGLAVPAASPAPVPATAAEKHDSGVIHQLPWILRQDPRNYTLQLASGVDEAAIRDLLESLSMLGETAYFKQPRHDGSLRYIALLGVFSSHTEANRLLQQLPPHLQKAHPWIRRFGRLQKILQPDADRP